MARDTIDETPLESRDQLVAWFEKGPKPKAKWLIGTEHEKFPFRTADLSPVAYEGPKGIEALLKGMQGLLGWEPIMEGPTIIGLADPIGGGAISLEPGGQFELSGAPLDNIHETCREVHAHLAQVREVGSRLGIGFLGLGMSPKWTRAETPVMPKGRYGIMTRYMPKVGALGLDMMYRTSTVQVNLDFASEADMVKKFRVSVALQPIATALFAASPFTHGRPNGFLSFRSDVWRHTDPDRSGMVPWVFEDGMGFERYADWALDVPMYFVKRGDTYHDVAGASFRDLMAGKLTQLPGVRAVQSDWTNHLSTLFPEVRLKRYLEMRGADGGPWSRLCALPAFWTGLLYDDDVLEAAWDLVKDWSAPERQAMRDAVPVQGLAAPFRRASVHTLAAEVLTLSKAGLDRRARADTGCDGRAGTEAIYLEPLMRTIETGETLAHEMLAKYRGDWRGDIDRAFEDYAY